MRCLSCRNAPPLHVAGYALTLILLLPPAARVHAGEITGLTWYSGVASVAGEIINPPSDPNNDDVVGPSPNIIYVLQKNYVGIGPVDLVFDVRDTGGVTEYMVNEGVWNGTGVDWSGYHLELGFGHGAGFVKSTSGDGLDFDAPDYNSDVSFSPFFASAAVTEHDIIAGDGTIPVSSYAGDLIFHIDVPDGMTSFTLRQSPIPVPEPAGVLLILIGMGFIGRRSVKLQPSPGERS